MSRRKGRVLAFQTLYSYEVGGIPLEDLLAFSWVSESGVPAEDTNKDKYVFARLLAAGTVEHLSEIDENIKKHLAANWDFDRVNKVSLSILRMSVYSLLYQKDIAASVVIDEAIQIAKEFGADDSFRFINAVLDKIGKAVSVPPPAEASSE
ncbi:transcription antitermination factor NusB [Treponema sp. Marseille-Q4130]|uniref:transcription antitermination factor NusB n=1 Tax=Treponema sp. Marseille-Q4130 TaxID=2766702 RepID=UPI001651CEEF|nr:transcription antitermination factor NusB [Treponema sp. Marseille-Q4130]